MEAFLSMLSQDQGALATEYIGFLRWAAPFLTLLLLVRCIHPLLTFRREPEIWAWLNLATGEQVPITHWENVIGRSKSCDVTIDFPTVSRNHAVLTRYDDGSWTITDVGSKEGTLVNGRKVQICALTSKERISIGGVEMQLQPITQRQEERQAQLRTKAASGWDTVTNLMLLDHSAVRHADGIHDAQPAVGYFLCCSGIWRHCAVPVAAVHLLLSDPPQVL